MDCESIQGQHMRMVSGLKKDGQKIIDSLTPEKADLWHMGTGVASEGGEVLDAIKKYVVYNKPMDRKNLIEELGDMEFFLEGIRDNTGITREECLEANIQKLLKGDRARYASGTYSDEQAIARADKTESREYKEGVDPPLS